MKPSSPTMIRRTLRSAFIYTASVLTLSACAVTTAGVTPGDERNMVRSLDDVTAARAIKARMKRAEGFRLGGVNVDVAQGIVVLAGNVLKPEEKVEAERIAWSAPNVIKVGNEILLKEKQTPIQDTKDAFLQQSVRTRLIADRTVKARNINLETHDGIVYLLGVARTPQELQRAAYVASTTKGTKEVISYVKVVGDTNFATGPDNENGYRAPVSPVYGAPHYGSSSDLGTRPNSPPLVHAPSAPQPSYRPLPKGLTTTPVPNAPNQIADALPDTEPYYVDPQTGKRIELPPGVVPIPFVPDTPGSLGAGALPPPNGGRPYYINPQNGKRIPVTALSNGAMVIESKYLVPR